MTRRSWHLAQGADGSVTLARRLPVRMDVSARTRLSAGRAAVLAHEVRKDVWRAVASVRGASPVVTATPDAEGVEIVAGLRIDPAGTVGGISAGLSQRIAAVLADPARRRRWVAHATRRGA